MVEIQNIKQEYHTINDKENKCVTSAYNSDGMVVKIEKDCLGENKPSNIMYIQKRPQVNDKPVRIFGIINIGKDSI